MPPNIRQRRLWLCIDSTSVIWGLRGEAPGSSQWAFHNCQDAMQTHDVRVRWAPGHTGIEGNEAADKLADLGARKDKWDAGPASEPTISGIRSTFRTLRREAQRSWWTSCSTKLSRWYKKWGLEYQVKLPPELNLPRATLHRLLAIRSSHGDFCWYHTKFKHTDAKLVCSCGQPKSPEHLVFCRKTRAAFKHWPARPPSPPTGSPEGFKYLTCLLAKPTDFAKLLGVAEFYSKICTR
jgi:RNase H